ncbi:hypothetical protein CKM354_000623700 [Cercospora kikuchii]|uniref:NmrA-like domain-containing protein n=1 Tax=Cercospora kikuchii TaxID=84275 RepID=A0A9P3FD45_9PEZI|nr:uncharacterized protein CKM354_000623700 [Cercospora kikuchii]GIZ42991.1 hypothetical protein CKM354_000623700 [Cercospora kikuchii]
MSPNRIAVYGHRGLFSSRIAAALIASDAHITILYRPGSDVANFPARTPKVEVDVYNQEALVAALQNIDIVISLVGDEGVTRQFGLVQAIPRTNVKLFIPSELGLCYGEDGMPIPVLKQKKLVQEAAKKAGIPMTIVLIANFAEFTLGSIAMGIDVEGNRVLYTGNSAVEKANMCTVDYVAAAYVSLFVNSPIAEIRNRTISLIELAPTGEDITIALKKKHGKGPQIFQQSTERNEKEYLDRLNSDLSAVAPAWYYRKLWGTGELTSLLSSDVWDVPSYEKATLDGLIVGGLVGPYRDLSPITAVLEEAMFR